MARVYIIEGVAGSGKDTLTGQLLDWLQPHERHVIAFPEEAVLASWVHYFVPGIHKARLELTQRLVEHIARTLDRDPEVVFVFNRFHVSHAVWRAELNAPAELEERHAELVEGLSELQTLVLQTMVETGEAESRTSHLERREIAWHRHLERRLETHGLDSVGAGFLIQQDAMSRIIERDGLPYRRVTVRRDTPIGIAGLVG